MKQWQRNAAVILSVCAILLGILGMVLMNRRFQETLIERQDENMMEFAGITDRNISNILRSSLSDLRYAIRQPEIVRAEKSWKETGDPGELRQNLSSLITSIEDIFVGVIVVSSGKVIASSDDAYGYSFYDADRFVNNEAGLDLDFVIRLKDGQELGTLALVVPSTGKDLRYAVLFDMKELYRKIAYTSVEGDKRILLFNSEYNVVVHDPGEYSDPGAMITSFRLEYMYPEIGFLKSCELANLRKAETYTEKGADGDDVPFRIAVLPSSVNRNGIFAVAVIDSYESTILPISSALSRIRASTILAAAGVVLMLTVLFMLNRTEISQLNEIRLLQAKQKETQEIMEKTQELAHTQRLTIIGTMTAGIAHEFNNLLTPIMGYSIMTLDKIPPEDAESYDNLIDIYEAARKAKAIISRLSLLSRRAVPGEFLPCLPDRIAAEATATAKPLKPGAVETILDLHCEDIRIRANEIGLHQMLLNLIINSFHAIGDRPGHVIVGTEPADGGVRFYVKDDGPGIPKEYMPRIYDPFFTTKESGKGTGLGLAIVAQTVQNHHGRISVDTAEGKGCCFTIYIPLEPEP